MTQPDNSTLKQKSLTPIEGEPTILAVNTLRREIYASAKKLKTRLHLGNGQLGIIMTDAAYTAHNNGVPYVVPVHPGEQAPLHGTAAAIAEAQRVYKQAVEDADNHKEAVDILRNLILDAVDNSCFVPLRDNLFGYDEVHPRDLLNHLITEYGTMTAAEIEKNRQKLTEEINIDEPLSKLWAKILDVQSAAPETEPISDSAAITLTIAVLEKTGVYETDITAWNNKSAADKTMANFRNHFNKANKERLRKLTAKTAGLHGANAASTAPRNVPAPYHHPTVGGATMAYCHTHGLSTNLAHTSATCTKKAEGHKDDATADNMMGGNRNIQVTRKHGKKGTNNGNRNQQQHQSAQA